MKIKFLMLIFILEIFPENVWSGKILVTISDIEENNGEIHYALYNNPESFPNEKGKILGEKKNVLEVKEEGFLIEDLLESFYAIAVYHDANSNNEFDSFLAIPTEKYGFSNDAPVFLGPPDFEDASFFVGENELVKVKIKLR